MVEDIYILKNKILQHIERETKNMDRIDVKEIGELVDMVKDLAEAEKSCWEASYYKAISEGMEDRAGYGSMAARSGYDYQPTRPGYTQAMGHTDLIDKIGSEYHSLSPNEKAEMKKEILKTLGVM